MSEAEPKPEATDARSGEPGAALFVWLVWLAMAALTLAQVAHYGRLLPFSDDWTLVPCLTGDLPVTASWLWQPFNEHRIPIPKLLWVGLLEGSRLDFRAPIFFDAGLMVASSAGLLLAARRIRGRWAFADAFLPLLLLHWDQMAFDWAFLLPFSSSVAMSAAVLFVAATTPGRLGPAGAAVAGLCVAALPLTGGQGLLLAAPLAAWLALEGRGPLRGPVGEQGRLASGIATAAAVGAAALCLLYVADLRTISESVGLSDSAHLRSPVEMLKAAVIFVDLLFVQVLAQAPRRRC